MRLWLHIGLPKTGTTFLQTTLLKNRAALLEQGILYPMAGLVSAGHMLFAPGVLSEQRKQLSDVSRLLDRARPELWDALAEEVREANPNSVILSTEYFTEAENLIALKRLCDKVTANVAVIVYLRRQDDYVEAGWSQAVKAGMTAEPLNLRQYDPRCDWQLFLDRWAAMFGRNALHVRVYGKAVRSTGIVNDFASIVGFDASTFDQQSSDRNERLHDAVLDYRRIENALGMMDSDLAQRASLRLGGKPLPMPMVDALHNVRAQFLACFAESNAVVARDYLGRANGQLFDEEENGNGAKEPPSAEWALGALIATSWTEMNRELQAMRDELTNLRRDLDAIKPNLRG